MKSGTPWSIRGIDDETRGAAEEAARLAGMSLGEWLRHTIADRAAEEGVHAEPPPARQNFEDDEAGDVALSLMRLVDRVRSLNAGARSAAGGLGARLDLIERELAGARDVGRGSGAGDASLRRVAAMIDRLSRELDDLDETARSAVEGRRERAGSPPGTADSLNQAIRDLDAQIAAMAERRKPEPERNTPYEALRERLDALLARAPEPPLPRASSFETTLRALEARIGEAREPRQTSALSPDEDERIRRIRSQLGDIARKLGEDRSPSPAARRPETPQPAGVAALHAEIAALSARIDELARGRGDPGAVSIALEATLLDRFDNLARRLPSQARLDALGDDVTALRAALERGELGPFARLEARMNELAGRVASELHAREAAAEASAAAIAATLADLRAAVEELALERSAAADPGALAALAADLVHLRAAVEALEAARRGDAKTFARIEARLDEIASAAAEGGDGLSAIGGVEERLDRIAASLDGALARVPDPDVVESIDRRLEFLSRKIGDSPAQEAPSAALDEIRAQMDAIRGDLARRDAAAAGPPESRSGDVPGPTRAVDPGELAEARDAHRPDCRRVRPDDAARRDLRQVEEDLTRLQASFPGRRRPVGEGRGGPAGDRKPDVASVPGPAAEGDADTEATMQSLEGSLASIVDRLGDNGAKPPRGETASPAPSNRRRGCGAGPSGRPQRATAAGDSGRGDLRTRRPGRTAAAARGPAASSYARRPSEPRDVRPDLAALRELAASSPQPERKAGDRRAEFIAAARRAAQAEADAGAGVVQGDRAGSLSTDPKHSPFARIGQAIRNRRKSLLLAAAIVLALGAVYLLSQRNGRISDLAAVAPAGEIPAVDNPPVAAPPAPAAADAPGMVAPPADARTAMALAADDSMTTGGIQATAEPTGNNAFAPPPAADDLAAQPVDSLVAPGLPAALRAAAAAGDPAAAFEIANRYAEGRGTVRDLARPPKWYARAAASRPCVAAIPSRQPLRARPGGRQGCRPGRRALPARRRAGQCRRHAQPRGADQQGRRRRGRSRQGARMVPRRRRTTASRTASTISASSMPAASAPRLDLVEAYKWFAIAAAGRRQGRGGAPRRGRGHARPEPARRRPGRGHGLAAEDAARRRQRRRRRRPGLGATTAPA